MVLGSAFLLGTIAGGLRLSVLGAFFFVILGALCAVFAIKLNKRSLYMFFAAFLIQAGFFLFLVALKIIPLKLSHWWPLLSVFTGLALVPAGWRRYGAIRSRYVVPALAFVILGCLLLIFSFDVVPFSFKQFILEWWPFLVVLAGLVLVLIALGTRNNTEEPKP
ncbi:MAG: DUF5668 domain-containing protein [Treponema sp.]|jgi:hypothetical protein|nr:DUF5668 domain-containing protein [Treponema sp.]